MRVLIPLVMLFMICGCSVVVQDGDQIRYYGLEEKDGLDTLEKIEEKQKEEEAQAR